MANITIDFDFEFKNKKLNDAWVKIDSNGNLQNGFYFDIDINKEPSILLTDVIALIKVLFKKRNQLEKEQDKICKLWEKDKNNTSYYNNEFLKLEHKIDELYKYYYDDVHAILTKDEVNQIQKEINYNFMSEKFYNKMIELLESKGI